MNHTQKFPQLKGPGPVVRYDIFRSAGSKNGIRVNSAFYAVWGVIFDIGLLPQVELDQAENS